jgi:hypothetical protein
MQEFRLQEDTGPRCDALDQGPEPLQVMLCPTVQKLARRLREAPRDELQGASRTSTTSDAVSLFQSVPPVPAVWSIRDRPYSYKSYGPIRFVWAILVGIEALARGHSQHGGVVYASRGRLGLRSWGMVAEEVPYRHVPWT